MPKDLDVALGILNPTMPAGNTTLNSDRSVRVDWRSVCASVVYEAVVSEAAWVGSVVDYCGPESGSSLAGLACERWGWGFVGVGYSS